MKLFSSHSVSEVNKRMNHLVVCLFFVFTIATGFISAQSAIFAGGPIYHNADKSINELRNSGFTTVIIWTIHINENGDLNFNAEFLICKNGKYVGQKKYPDFPNDVALLKTEPTSINRIEIGLSAWGSNTFDNIKTLIELQGTDESTILYKNFKALLDNIPVIDAINFDDESTYDSESATAFAIMLTEIGYKVTLAPYKEKEFWTSVALNTNKHKPNSVDAIYLQCYDGGRENSPCDWINIFQGIPVYPGLWSKYDNYDEVEDHLVEWKNECNIKGAFMWLYDEFQNSPAVSAYANSINTSLGIEINLFKNTKQ